MIQEVRDRVLAILGTNFSTEQLQMIDCAVRDALRGMKVEREAMLPAKTEPAWIGKLRNTRGEKRPRD